MRLKIGFKTALVTLSLLFFLSNIAFANHYVYLGEDLNKQLDFPGSENRVNYWWALPGVSIYWWADSTLQNDASTAVTNWNNAVSMPWFNSGESNADVTIRADNSIPFSAEHRVVAVSTDNDRNANYVKTSAIKVNPNLSPNIPRSIGHELGHFIGLHERYRDDGSSGDICATDSSTIMNAPGCSNYPTAPSSLDTDRAKAMYQNGDLLNISGTGGSGSFTVTWKDGAWGEFRYSLYFYRWDGSKWVQLGSYVGHTQDTGLRETSWNSRTLSHTFFRSTYGTGPGWYEVCGWSRHKYGSGYGTWRCSNYAWVS